MEKRTYIQPLNKVSELIPVKVLCVISTPVDNTPENDMEADAPKRRTPVF
jgi:hypothetical protein